MSDGVWLEDEKDIGTAFSNHFQAIFGVKRNFRFLANLPRLFNHKDPMDLCSLEILLPLEEIEKVTFDLRADKMPGIDGFPLAFFQNHQDTVQADLSCLCYDFLNGKANLERINWENIIFIPKKDAPSKIGDFWSISLINTPLKIISKILGTRLSQVINALIDKSQAAFVKGRCISDNIVVTDELIFSIQKRKLNDHIFKVDFAKTFNMVDQEFLLDILVVRGFCWKWISQIRTFLETSKINILINGSPSEYIRYQHGLY